jgi:hypothetical protein
MATDDDDSPLLAADGITRVRQVVGTFLFYARAVDSTMLVALGSIAAQQSAPTTDTEKDVTKFLDYAYTHPDTIIRYVASDMVLHCHSDASYLSERRARSRCGGHHWLSSHPTHRLHQQSTVPTPPNNGAVLTVSNIMKNVMAAASEAELGGVFFNAREGDNIIVTLEEMDCPQPPFHIVTDNSTASGIANRTVKQKRSKAMDMRFYWVQDRVDQNRLRVTWEKGESNRGDYYTKHHPPNHHRAIRPTFHPEPH